MDIIPDNNVSDHLFEYVAPSSKMKSSVWRYFGFYKNRGCDTTHYDKTLCMLCHHLLAYNSGNTTNMRHHLIKSHKLDPDALPPPVKTVIELNPKGIDEDLFEIVPAPPSLKALVWKYFGFYKKKGAEKAEVARTCCKLCRYLITYSQGSTTNMRSHLKTQHNIQLHSLHEKSKQESTASTPDFSVENESTHDDSSEQTEDEEDFATTYEFVKQRPTLKSSVWKYFDLCKMKGSDDSAGKYTCCRLCKVICKYNCGSTTNMRYHLNRVHKMDFSELDSDEPVATTIKHVKQLLQQQLCANSSCQRRISLEPDGSPPQFCAGCGLLLSSSLSGLWSACRYCCQLCGKFIDSKEDPQFCSRCGGYLHEEVKSFPSGDEDDKSQNMATCKEGAAEPGNIELVPTTSGRVEIKIELERVAVDDFTNNGSYQENEPKTHFECDFCHFTSDDNEKYQEHLKTHFDMYPDGSSSLLSEEEEHKDSFSDMVKHSGSDVDSEPGDTKETQAESNTLLECSQCDVKCTNKKELKRHKAQHKAENLKTGKQIVRYCKTCNEEFQSLFLLKMHEKAQKCTEKVLACDECPYITTKVEAFRGHKRRNHGNVTLKKCDHCNRTFKRQRNLEEHMNTHTGLTPFQCDKCGKAFHTNSSWYKHRRNNCESGLRERKLCSHCGRAVINLSKHISEIHFNVKDFRCGTCGKCFGTQYHLDRHVRTHTGEKPFPCKYCDYRANQKVVTETHMKKCKFRPLNAGFTSDVVMEAV